MHLFDESIYSPTSVSNKNKLVPKGKLVKPSQKKSNFDFLLLCSNVPIGPRPCQSITLIYFHHAPIILKLLPFNSLVVLKNYKIEKYIEQKFVFAIKLKPCIRLPSCFRGDAYR